MFSPLLEELIQNLQCLPGIGKKSAQRIVFYLLQYNRAAGVKLGRSLEKTLGNIRNCERCQTFSENSLCLLCMNPQRHRNQLCVVETPADVLALEQTASYQGLYFVLMGHISPIDGMGPDEIGLPKLLEIIRNENIEEVILATNATVEGEATAHFIADSLKPLSISCTRIAHGVPLDGELGYLDSGTIARAFKARVAFNQ